MSLGPEDHQVLERMLEKRRTAEGPEVYFPVSWTGIRDTPVGMRFGKCLWESRAGGGARHLVVLVSEHGDTAGKLAGLQLFQPELTRMMQHMVITRMKLDALITELHQSGVLPSEAVGRLDREVDVLPFDLMREFERANDVEEFSTDAATGDRAGDLTGPQLTGGSRTPVVLHADNQVSCFAFRPDAPTCRPDMVSTG